MIDPYKTATGRGLPNVNNFFVTVLYLIQPIGRLFYSDNLEYKTEYNIFILLKFRASMKIIRASET